MRTSPNDVADPIRNVNTPHEAVEDPRLRAPRAADTPARGAWAAELGTISPEPTLTTEPGPAWLPRTDWSLDAGVGNGSSLASPDGQLCGLFAVDIVGFNGCRR